jgi:hypothetical protein
MIQAESLAYYDKTTAAFKPVKAAHEFKDTKDKVALLWGDEVYVISVGRTHALVSAKGHHLKVPVADLRETPILRLPDRLRPG